MIKLKKCCEDMDVAVATGKITIKCEDIIRFSGSVITYCPFCSSYMMIEKEKVIEEITDVDEALNILHGIEDGANNYILIKLVVEK